MQKLALKITHRAAKMTTRRGDLTLKEDPLMENLKTDEELKAHLMMTNAEFRKTKNARIAPGVLL